MRHLLGWVSLLVLSSNVLAQEPLLPSSPSMALDKISFQLSAKQWNVTQSALLNVNINCTLISGNLVKTRADIMERLNKIAKGDWHLLQFARSQDNSGMEKLFVRAQIRLSQAALTNVYQQAQSVSKQGAQYTVDSIEFTPSLEDIQKIKLSIREQIYQQVNNELARINKAFAPQHYSINSLVFIEGESSNQQPAFQPKIANTMIMAATAPAPVGNEISLTAYVEAASSRKMP